MPITSANKTTNKTFLAFGDTMQVTLSVTAEPTIISDPVKIALLLDRSGSMRGQALESLKDGAQDFVRIIAQNTGSPDGSELLGGSEIGVISFSASATVDSPLTTSVAQLDAAIEALQAQGNTNQAAAFGQAQAMLGNSGRRICVMFTDGEPTVGPDPAPVAQELRDSGVEIYCIGLVGTDGINEETLRAWASTPSSKYVRVSPTPDELEQLFKDVAEDISEPGAENILIEELVSEGFVIVDIATPEFGMVDQLSPRALNWRIPVLGKTGEQTASLTFTVRYEGSFTGIIPVNESIRFTDDARDDVRFPDPTVNVEGGSPEPDPDCEPIELCMPACEDVVSCDLGDITLHNQGRMLRLRMTLKNVCPGKRVAVGIALTEMTCSGIEKQRGFQAITVPAHFEEGCTDVAVGPVTFVLPEDPEDEGCGRGGCKSRRMKVCVMAHTIDWTDAESTAGEPCVQ